MTIMYVVEGKRFKSFSRAQKFAEKFFKKYGIIVAIETAT